MPVPLPLPALPTGQPFMVSEGTAGARIMIIGDYPTADDLKLGRPFTGASGYHLDKALDSCGLSRSMCHLTFASSEAPPFNPRTKDADLTLWLWRKKAAAPPGYAPHLGTLCAPPLLSAIAALKARIQIIQPTLIIALGDLSLFALLGETSSDNFHGSMFAERLSGNGIKTVCAYSSRRIMRSYADRMFLYRDFKRAASEFKRGPAVWQPSYRFIIQPSFDAAVDCLRLLIAKAQSGPLKLAVDIETRLGHIACLGIAWSTSDAICLPFMRAEGADPHYWLCDEEASIVQLCADLLMHPNAQVVGQNFIYDQQYLIRRLGIQARFARDTMLAQHVLYPDQPKGLDTLSSLYCEHHYYWKGESKDWDPSVGERQYWEYNLKDAVKTYEIDDRQQPLIDEAGLREVHDFQQQLFWPVLRAMVRGIRVNEASREATRIELARSIEEHDAWLADLLGHPLNVGSAPQMKKLFFEDLALPVQKNRKTGKPTLAGEAMSRIAQKEPLVKDLIAVIESRRSLAVFHNTFICAPLDEDGRMRCGFNIGGTATYRFSSRENAFGSGMNLQNLPRGDD